MRISDFAVSADPIDRLVAKGAPVRALVALELGGVEWLALHQDERFRLCYYDESGAVATQDVDAVGLVLRAQELGWTAMRDLEPGPNPWLFDQASYHLRQGIHWFASATDMTDELLPLAFPEGVLKRAAKAQEREMAAARKARDAKVKAAARSRKREDREARAWLIEYSAQCHLDKAKSAGTQMSVAQARRAARILVDGIVSRAQCARSEGSSDAITGSAMSRNAKNE